MAGNNQETRLQKITPFLWFNDNAEEAVNFYVSIFENSKIEGMTHYGKAGPMQEGMVMTVTFQLAGQAFVALNGGPEYTFTPAILPNVCSFARIQTSKRIYKNIL